MRNRLTLLIVMSPASAAALGVCFVTPPDGYVTTVDCDQITPTEWQSAYVGFSADAEPCSSDCSFLGCCSPLTQSHPYGWTLSASPTDPHVNTGSLAIGVDSLFVFLSCTRDGGAAAAGFSFLPDDPGLVVTGFEPVPGVLNAGTATDPLLAIGGCPRNATLIGTLRLYRIATPVKAASWGSVKALYR